MARRPAIPDVEATDELAAVVQTLSDEVRILRMALDELREELQWAK